MRANWKKNKNLNPNIILSKIDSMKNVSTDKRVSYSGFEYHNAMAVLQNMVQFPKGLSDLNHESIVTIAVRNIAKDFNLEQKAVITEINRLIRIELATKEFKFHMLSSISVDNNFPFKRIQFEGCQIRIFNTNFPNKYIGRNELLAKHKWKIDPLPHQYSKMIVSVKAKSTKGAATKALRIIDIPRAIWCLFSNSGMEIWNDEWRPINKIRLGGTHTIHKDSGIISGDSYWYEPNFVEADVIKLQKPIIFKNNCTWALKKLADLSYSSTLKEAMVRYVRALDERDPNVALIKLWGALEALAAPSSANYDLVTRRCAFLFAEHNYHKQVLENLRDYRNSSVHAGDQSERAKTSCYQLQFYFHYLVLFHLHHGNDFKSLDEANSFLDLPAQIKILEKRRQLIEKAIKFVS